MKVIHERISYTDARAITDLQSVDPLNLKVAKSRARDNKQMRPPGIEPGLEAWEATVIPLDHGRLLLL